MSTNKLIENIQAEDFSAFEKEWLKQKESFTEEDKQNLLFEIVENYYTDKSFGFFVKVFNKIIDSKVSLDFNVDHWAPTFLSLSVELASRRLFDYFIQKGASINFIGDEYAFESEEIKKQLLGDHPSVRYVTCLDFAENKRADLLTVNYYYAPAEKALGNMAWQDVDEKEEITIKKEEYYYLIEQSQYLYELIQTDRLVEYIKSLGGKSYEELPNQKKRK